MRPGISSKRSKKNSDEERSKTKKTKPNKRRRHDSSSSSSYSSDSEIDARSRKKSARWETKRPEKRRKGSKKPVKKKSRKTHLRDARSGSPRSYSSRSCSTCRSSSGGGESDSGRSRSPVARGKRRAKLRGRSRSKSPLARADRKAKLRGRRSRSRSPRDHADRRVKSRERSRYRDRERGGSRRSSQRTNYERDGDRYWSRSRESSSSRGSHSSGQSYSEEKGKEVDQPRRLKSALVVTKEPEGMEGLGSRDKIVWAYDDVGRNFDSNEQASKDRQVELGQGKHATDTQTKLHREPSKDADVVYDDDSRIKCGDAVNSGNSEPKDLELLLRQKALENFRKFRGGLSANTTAADQKDESVHIESCKDAGRLVEAKNDIISSKCQSNDSLACQGSIQKGSSMTQRRIRSIVNIPTENDDGNSVICCENASESSRRDVNSVITGAADGQTTLNHLRTIEGPKDIHNKKAAAEPGSSTTLGAELKVDDGSASVSTACLNVESGKKAMEGNRNGSQFEQKTFSRTHDGEMVQVSYKVYIPKKSPALARRQLQQ